MAKEKQLVLGVTASIAAYRAADLIRDFQDKELKVSVVMTKGAENFITPLTLSSLAGEEVYSEMFSRSNKDWKMPHIELAKKADVLLIAPATANMIGKLANGLADDLLTCVALATKAKIFIAPAMNTEMFLNKIVQENVRKLEQHGFEFIHPIEGSLACGDYGTGHIAENATIVETVVRSLK